MPRRQWVKARSEGYIQITPVDETELITMSYRAIADLCAAHPQ